MWEETPTQQIRSLVKLKLYSYKVSTSVNRFWSLVSSAIKAQKV